MKVEIKQVLTLGFLLLSIGVVVGQPGWNWGDSVDKAKEKNALYTDYLRADDFINAEPHLAWLLKNTPDLNKSIYINGAKVYEGLADEAKDDSKVKMYQEKALKMYDLRIEYFNEEADVLNRKAYTAYKYFRGESSKYKELLGLFDRAFELNGEEFFDNNLVAYMDVVRRYKLAGNPMTDEVVFNKYFAIVDLIDLKEKNGGNVDRLEKVRENVDKILTATGVELDCNFIEENLGPKFEETGDMNLAKKIFGLMLSQKCTDSPLALKTAEAVNEEEPSFGISKFLGVKYASEKNYSEAQRFYEQAIELADDNEKKAEIYLFISRTQYAQNNKPAARASARRALSFNPGYSDAYKFIGDLYMNSFNDCKGGESKVIDRAVYIAAYEMYEKAGDREYMDLAKAQFPSIEEIFSENYEEGKSLQVGCWINESVVIERRPAN